MPPATCHSDVFQLDKFSEKFIDHLVCFIYVYFSFAVVKITVTLSIGFKETHLKNSALYGLSEACSLQVGNFITKPMQHGYLLMSDW